MKMMKQHLMRMIHCLRSGAQLLQSLDDAASFKEEVVVAAENAH